MTSSWQRCPDILNGEACVGQGQGKCGKDHLPRTIDQIPCYQGYRVYGICIWDYCPFRHPTDKEFLEKQQQVKKEYNILKICQYLKVGDICIGGPNSSCGLKHSAPLKYCPRIAVGEACAGECGFDHIKMV